MTNKEIAEPFQLLALLLEFHQEDEFRVKSAQNTYRVIRNAEQSIAEMSPSALQNIKGIGVATAKKIQEILQNGTLIQLKEYLDKTPKGILQLFQLKGLGIKKILQLHQELQIESPGELLYACQENRLIGIKGFGQKTQENIAEQIHYQLQSQGYFRWASIEKEAEDIQADFIAYLNTEEVYFTGSFRRYIPVIDILELTLNEKCKENLLSADFVSWKQKLSNEWIGTHHSYPYLPLKILFFSEETKSWDLIRHEGPKEFIDSYFSKIDPILQKETDPKILFSKHGLPYIEPESREMIHDHRQLNTDLIQLSDIKGVIHAHSTYSDGAETLENLALFCKDLGFQYLGITDHSQSAFYANGLKKERVLEQWKEIDQLNSKFVDFKIFKGIESDIKYDGSLDYESDLLAGFDFVIASIHSQLKMDRDKATDRLIKAIENPYTTMLGHPTGRLLLSRPAYPIDHKKVIDACADNQVAIEINANPLRLDLDYVWIPYALSKSVSICINPDAHSKSGVYDIRYGVFTARKAALHKKDCINTFDAKDFNDFIQKRKSR